MAGDQPIGLAHLFHQVVAQDRLHAQVFNLLQIDLDRRLKLLSIFLL